MESSLFILSILGHSLNCTIVFFIISVLQGTYFQKHREQAIVVFAGR